MTDTPDSDDFSGAPSGDAETVIGAALDHPVRPVARDEAPGTEFSGSLDDWCARQRHNDLGNARRFYKRYGSDLIYWPEVGWLGWDGRRWDRKGGEFIAHRAAQDTTEAMHREADLLEREKEANWANRLRNWAGKSGSSGAIAAMQREARPWMLRDGNTMDAQPFAITCRNGTVDLGNPESFRKHRREDYITRLVEANYEGAAECPMFERFLETILPDSEVREFVQRWFGYNLTGDTREQVAVMLLGRGSNGKSTLLRLLAAVMGDLHGTVNIATFKDDPRRGGSDATPDIAILPGVRFLTATEPRIGFTIDEARIKELSGGEAVSARMLHRGFFEFVPQCKITLAFNNQPAIRGNDHGTWRRFLLVEFTEIVDSNIVGPTLSALEAERSGILNWLVMGARAWFSQGLAPPDVVRATTDEFRRAQGGVHQFMNDFCSIGDEAHGRSTPFADLFRAWEVWCRDQREEPRTKKLFGNRLKEAGILPSKSGDALREDIALNDRGRAAIDDTKTANMAEVRG